MKIERPISPTEPIKAYLNDESRAMIDCIVDSYGIKKSRQEIALDNVTLLRGFLCDTKFDSLMQAIKKNPVLHLIGVRFVQLRRRKQNAKNAQQLVMLQFEAHDRVKSEINDIALCCCVKAHLPYLILGTISTDAMNSFSMFAKYEFNVNIDVDKTFYLNSSIYRQKETNSNGLVRMLKWCDIFSEFRKYNQSINFSNTILDFF